MILSRRAFSLIVLGGASLFGCAPADNKPLEVPEGMKTAVLLADGMH